MNTSDAGLDFIRQHEGCKLDAYQDSVGVWTVGVGHTAGVKEGDSITDDQATEFLRADVKEAEDCVNGKVLVPLTQNEFDALVSFVFNLGCGTFKASSVLTKLNASDYDGAAKVMLKYNHAGGAVLAGLTTRREAEVSLFESA